MALHLSTSPVLTDMADFNPALPQPIKWSTGSNRYDQDGKTPRSISLFVPLDSIKALQQYLTDLAADIERHKPGKIWNYETKSEEQVTGVYINGKGREGSDGDYGTINPAVIVPF